GTPPAGPPPRAARPAGARRRSGRYVGSPAACGGRLMTGLLPRTSGYPVRRRSGDQEGAEGLPVSGCRNRSAPDGVADLVTMQTASGRRARGGQPGVRAGAYAAAVREKDALASGTLPGTAGTWEPVGSTPEQADDPRFGEVNGEGLADLNGRIADYA